MMYGMLFNLLVYPTLKAGQRQQIKFFLAEGFVSLTARRTC